MLRGRRVVNIDTRHPSAAELEAQYDRTFAAFAAMETAHDLAAYAVARATFIAHFAALRAMTGTAFAAILDRVPETHRAELEAAREGLTHDRN
jgi:hypothetical protein